MKTVKEVLLSLFVIALVFACNKPDPLVQSQKKHFQLEAEIIDDPFYAQDYLRLEIAEASNCNFGETVIVTVFGILDTQSSSSEIDLPHGEIEFLNRESGCYLIGQFNGKVTAQTDGLTLDAIVKIEYGIGVFEADGGELRLSIKGINVQDDQMRYEILIDGYLEHRVKTIS